MNKKLLAIGLTILSGSLLSTQAIACQQPDVNKLDYSQLGCLNEGLAVAQPKGQKYGYLNKSGNAVIRFQYDDAGRFKEGLAPVKKDGKWGYINKSGGIQINCQYDYVSDFSGGLASVRQGSKNFKINTTGQELN